MKLLLQRVSSASVAIDGHTTAQIGRGFLVLVGFTHTDTIEQVQWMSDKILGLRIFPDAEGKMNLSLADIGGEILVVSQFTLYGNAEKGRRPSFIDAARPEVAEPLYESMVAMLRASGINVATGRFGEEMQVSLVNDGPTTLILER